jgi:putative endonuclease
MLMNDWTVYILRCGDRSLYTGVTIDLERRLREHNDGTGAKYTRAHLPCTLAWSKNGFNESSAKKEEARIKKLSKNRKEELINQ